MNATAYQRTWTASRIPLIALWRAANTSLDTVFYDVSALSPEERLEMSHYTPEGTVMVVHPASARQPITKNTAADFADSSKEVDTIVIAGVGSSAVGTAALARNVADHLDRPVAGIVSGLGVADVITEALGGWFVLRGENATRDLLARVFDAWELPDHVRDPSSHDRMKQHFAAKGADPEWFIYGSPDSTALLFLLSKLRSKIKLLVGHSKWNYSIENALEGFHRICQTAGESIPADLRIITMGAVIWFGPEFRNVQQYIGGLDGFGAINSRLDVDCYVEPHVWHSLNQMLPGHMEVARVLEKAGVGI